jgi:hypothetical protein
MLAVVRDVSNPFPGLGIRNNRTKRHADDNILAAFAGFVPPHATLAVLRLVFPQVPEIDQRVQSRITLEIDAAAPAAIPTVRTTVLDVLFPAKRCRTVAALAGMDFDIGFVNEFHAAILSLIPAGEVNPDSAHHKKTPPGRGFRRI